MKEFHIEMDEDNLLKLSDPLCVSSLDLQVSLINNNLFALPLLTFDVFLLLYRRFKTTISLVFPRKLF